MYLEVFVRTRGRVNKQSTLKHFFLLSVIERLPWLALRIVVPRSEYKAYLKANPDCRGMIRVVPDEGKSGSVFQYVLESTKQFVFCLDDDLSLGRRRKRLEISQRGSKATVNDVVGLFKRIRHWLNQGYVHGGLSLRQTNHYVTDAYYKSNTRICCGASFWDAQVIRKEKIRFDTLQARSCCHVWLSLLELGYQNVCDYEFIVGQTTNTAGGCSDYRTPQFMRKQAQDLIDLHSGVVSHFYKQRKSASYNSIQTEKGIPDVRVLWQKALGLKQ